ncbi:MAG: DUF6544 family protein [Pseudomonadota bacterium]
MKAMLLNVLAVVAVFAIAAHYFLSAKFKAKVSDLKRRLVESQELVALPDQSLIPALVRTFSEKNGGRVNGPSVVYMRQSAEMRLAPGQQFFHIDGEQISGTKTLGFVWEASGRMFGALPLRVVDSFVSQSGWLGAMILGTVPVANAKGPAIDKGEVLRFLAELAWNPDALVNTNGLFWNEADEHTVEVGMDTRDGRAKLNLLFDLTGDIVGINASDRPRAVGNRNVPTRWVGRFSDYEWNGDYRFPRHGEIAWVLPTGEFVYWRGDILSVSRAPL